MLRDRALDLSLTAEERSGIGRHVQLCIEELHDLFGRLDDAKKALKAKKDPQT
jgi:hypothetical protein